MSWYLLGKTYFCSVISVLLRFRVLGSACAEKTMKNLQNPLKYYYTMNKMEHVKFEPWKGDNYDTGGIFGKKILAIGESFYCSEEDAVATLTDKIVTDYLAIRDGEYRENDGGWTNTYLKFERSLTGEETTPEDSHIIWNSIAFYNYLQVPMSGARESGSTIDYKNAENAFGTTWQGRDR